MASQSVTLTIDWKPIILRGGGVGAAVGLWTGVWIGGFLALWERGLVTPGVSIPDQFDEFTRINAESVVPSLWRAVHLDLPTRPLPIALTLMLIGAVLGAVVVSAARLARLDPDSIGFHSFRWALRSMLDWRALLVCGTSTLAVIAGLYLKNLLLLIMIASSAFIAALILIPIFMCREQVASKPRATGWWTSIWPGFKTLGLFLLIEACAVSLDLLDSSVSPTWPAAGLLVLAIFFCGDIVAPLLQGTLLMANASHTLWDWRSVFTWRWLGPWIAYNLWLLLIPLLLIGPVLVEYVWQWKVVPGVATLLDSQGATLPWALRLIILTSSVIGRYYWLIFLVPASLFFWMGTASFIWEINSATPENPGDLSTRFARSR